MNGWNNIGQLIWILIVVAIRICFWGGVVVLACTVAFITFKILS